ncbi:MAG: hypothetical protein DLM72_13070 [Candidatus Nitrosopolaris wilkensis]|nr:MAG: hypothetical protein DLM72_13070 [Candidatus Nitrosopolaris wilkensis]
MLEKEDAESKLYNLFQEQLFKIKPESTSFVILGSKLIKKIHDKGLFGQYVSILRDVIHSKSITDITSFGLLLQNSVNLRFRIPANAIIFVDAWEQAIDELEPDTKRFYLYEQKLDIDQKMGRRHITKEYEKLRFDIRDDPEVVALEVIVRNVDDME